MRPDGSTIAPCSSLSAQTQLRPFKLTMPARHGALGRAGPEATNYAAKGMFWFIRNRFCGS